MHLIYGTVGEIGKDVKVQCQLHEILEKIKLQVCRQYYSLGVEGPVFFWFICLPSLACLLIAQVSACVMLPVTSLPLWHQLVLTKHTGLDANAPVCFVRTNCCL